ncbi:hypothetical protein HPB47_014499, partial [Ixodes persulcatus]
AKFDWRLWKLNLNLLADGIFLSAVEEGFGSHLKSAGSDIFEEWETFKQKVKMLAIERSSVSAYQTRHLESVKERLEELNEERYRGAVVRADRKSTYLMGEQPTKRALADEKRYALRNEIGEIEYQGVTSTNPSFIQRAFVAHYRPLFESQEPGRRNPVCGELLEPLPQLTEEE